jgi:hypothetical protein
VEHEPAHHGARDRIEPVAVVEQHQARGGVRSRRARPAERQLGERAESGLVGSRGIPRGLAQRLRDPARAFGVDPGLARPAAQQCQRHRTRAVERAAGEVGDGAPLECRARRQRVEQRRLAGARLARDQQDAGAALARARPALDRRQLALAPDDHHRAQPLGERTACGRVHALERPAHRAGIVRPLGRIGGEHLQHELNECRGRAGFLQRLRGRRARHLPAQRRRRGVGLEGRAPGGERVERGAEAVEVGGSRRGLAAHDFGGGEAGGATMALVVAAADRGQAEVQQTHAERALAGNGTGHHQEVRGLEVAVDHAGRVQRLEPVRHLGGDEEQRRPVAAGERPVGGKARHVLHRVEGGAVGSEAQLVHRHHRRVAQAGQRLELAAREVGGRGGGAGAQALERALGSGREVTGEEHLAHAARTETFEKDVTARQPLAHGLAPTGSPPDAPSSCHSRSRT